MIQKNKMFKFFIKEMQNSKSHVITSVLCFVLSVNVIAGGRPVPPGNVGDNIAFNKPYTMSPAPSYSGCIDSGDATQLTDGAYATGDPIWTKLPTVGWQSSANPTIIIDLGQVQPIRGVSYSTAGGSAGVQWPTAINLSVSNDGINYYSIGELANISNTEHSDAPVYGTYAAHRYYTNAGLATHGRFVKFQVTQSPYTFVDEIEIYRGANTLLQNIALGCSYTRTTPNYTGCTDSGVTQITNGSYSTSSPTFWTQSTTVGWSGSFPNPWVDITIDLGSKQPIEGISFNTAARAYDVEWPISITVLVSDDNVTYYNAGELISRSAEHGLPPPTGYLVRSYWTDRFATCGRYVKVMPAKNGYYLFVDEIEIYRGNNGMLSQPSRGTAVATDQATLTALVKKDMIRAGMARRIALDAQDVQAQADAQPGLAQATRDQIKALLTTSVNEAIYLADADPVTFQTRLPLNSSHVLVFSALKTLWQAQGKTNLIGWHTSSPWDPLVATQSPGSSTGIGVTMLQGEYRASAFNLSNASNNDLTVSVNIQGLPGGTNPSYITVQEAIWTDTKSGEPIVAALPDAAFNNGFTINIPAGMTRQIWLTFHPVMVNPGTYNGTVVANGGAAGTVNIPVSFRLSSMGFPVQPALSLGGFDYTDSFNLLYGWMTQNKATFTTNLIAYLRGHFVDTTWGLGGTSMPTPAAFTQFDAWAARWPGVRNYRIFLNAATTFNGYQKGTVEFNTAVATWINAYAAHWQGMGLNLSQIALHLVDEPHTAEQADTVVQWANAIHAVQPNLKIWNDPTFSDPSVSYALSMFQSVDMLCPSRPAFIAASDAYRNVFRQQQAAGKTLNFYSCLGPVGKLDPYSYYRLQAWTCWDEGATAMFYWVFGDSGGSAWNEFQPCSNYTPFFIDNTPDIITGKQMEAIREGVEDYEYLVMLKNRITELGGNAEAQTLLDGAASAVLNATGASQLNWANTKDRSIADQKRIEVLNMLEALGPQTGDNIAKGRTYTLSPTPNYSYCTDSGDISQLTDGIYSTIPIWTKLPTVGWYGTGTATITIDLGSVQTIQGVSFSTAGGISGVQWPTAIDMSVSNDGANYSSIGELVGISNSEHGDAPTYGTYQAHRYWTKSLSPSNGRYVKIIVSGSPYKFADEIEVYRN